MNKNNFNDLERMKALINHGRYLTEYANKDRGHIVKQVIAQNGKSYAIIRESAYYYIKSATPVSGQELVAENYDYIGSSKAEYAHHKYSSYNKALKNLEMKVSYINENCGNCIDDKEALTKHNSEWVDEKTKDMRAILNKFRDFKEVDFGLEDTNKDKQEMHDHPAYQKPLMKFDDEMLDGVDTTPYGEKIGDGEPFYDVDNVVLADMISEAIEEVFSELASSEKKKSLN